VLDPASAAALEQDRAVARRNLDILREFAAREPAGKPKRVRLRFYVSPVAILGEGRVEAIELERNRLVPDGLGGIKAEPTGELEVVPCDVVFRSVGYRGVELPGVPFDERRATIRNEGGRVVHADGSVFPGVYCAGWIKRGPSGVIGTNKKDAAETVERLVEDVHAGVLSRESDETLEDLLDERGVDFLEYAPLAGDRRARAWTGVRAGASAREADHVGRAPRARPAAAGPGLDSIPMSETGVRRELWGAETAKAIGNFPISGGRSRCRWRAGSAGSRPRRRSPTPSSGCWRRARPSGSPPPRTRIAAGELDDQFPVDVFQTGSGTSSNMNANEVIATLAGEDVHPNDDVNMGQSRTTSSPRPSTSRRSASSSTTCCRRSTARRLARGEGARVRRRRQVRPHALDGRRARHARPGVRRLRGAGARGTRAVERRSSGSARSRSAAPPSAPASTRTRVRRARARAPRRDTGCTISPPADPFESQAARDGLVEASGALKVVAVSLTKIANDLRCMGSGPRAGLAEIFLPELQKGSSIMPGKVNPVIPRS
jgi:hypothetical protein